MPFWTAFTLSELPNSFYWGVQLDLAICEYLLFKVIFDDVYFAIEIEKPHPTAEKWLFHAVF